MPDTYVIHRDLLHILAINKSQEIFNKLILFPMKNVLFTCFLSIISLRANKMTFWKEWVFSKIGTQMGTNELSYSQIFGL